MPSASLARGVVIFGRPSAAPCSSNVVCGRFRRRRARPVRRGTSCVASLASNYLGLVDLGALQLLEARDLVQRQIGEEAQEAADIGIFDVAPELPVVVGRAACPR